MAIGSRDEKRRLVVLLANSQSVQEARQMAEDLGWSCAAAGEDSTALLVLSPGDVLLVDASSANALATAAWAMSRNAEMLCFAVVGAQPIAAQALADLDSVQGVLHSPLNAQAIRAALIMAGSQVARGRNRRGAARHSAAGNGHAPASVPEAWPVIPEAEQLPGRMMLLHNDEFSFLLSGLLASALGLSAAQRGSVMLLEPDNGLRLYAAVGLPQEAMTQAESRMVSGVAARVAESGQYALINDRGEIPSWAQDLLIGGRPRSSLCLPLKADGRVIGVLNLSREPRHRAPFRESDVKALEMLCNCMASAISHARESSYVAHKIDELQRMDALKTLLINIAAHEMSTPLGVIRGYSELLPELTEEERQAALTHIVRNTDQLHHILEDLSLVKSIQPATSLLNSARLDLREVAEVCVQEAMPQAEAKDQQIVKALGEAPLWVMADAYKLGLVITNLLSNAIKFSPEGSTVRIRAWSAESEIGVSVSDEGPGIAAEEREIIFTRHYRGQAAREVSASGLGLGLAISYELMRMHRGRIWVEPGAPPGATLSIALPRAGYESSNGKLSEYEVRAA